MGLGIPCTSDDAIFNQDLLNRCPHKCPTAMTFDDWNHVKCNLACATSRVSGSVQDVIEQSGVHCEATVIGKST